MFVFYVYFLCFFKLELKYGNTNMPETLKHIAVTHIKEKLHFNYVSGNVTFSLIMYQNFYYFLEKKKKKVDRPCSVTM